MNYEQGKKIESIIYDLEIIGGHYDYDKEEMIQDLSKKEISEKINYVIRDLQDLISNQ